MRTTMNDVDGRRRDVDRAEGDATAFWKKEN